MVERGGDPRAAPSTAERPRAEAELVTAPPTPCNIVSSPAASTTRPIDPRSAGALEDEKSGVYVSTCHGPDHGQANVVIMAEDSCSDESSILVSAGQMRLDAGRGGVGASSALTRWPDQRPANGAEGSHAQGGWATNVIIAAGRTATRAAVEVGPGSVTKVLRPVADSWRTPGSSSCATGPRRDRG